MDNKVLVPVEQAMVPFYGSEILAVRLPDGQIAASLRSLCNMLKLARQGQMERIRRDENLTGYLLLAVVKTSGGSQRMEVLMAEAIPPWVMGIQDKLIAPEKRLLVHNLKMEIVTTLYRHFLAGQAAQPMAEPQAAPLSPPSHGRSRAAADSSWDRLFDALHDIQQEARAQAGQIVEMREWLTSLDRRVGGTGQGSAAGLGWIPLLSAAHLADARELLRSLEQSTGRAQAQLEQEMIETFGVSAMNAIPDEQWSDVLAWGLWRARQPQ